MFLTYHHVFIGILYVRNSHNPKMKDTVRGDKDGFCFITGNTDKCNKLLTL